MVKGSKKTLVVLKRAHLRFKALEKQNVCPVLVSNARFCYFGFKSNINGSMLSHKTN